MQTECTYLVPDTLRPYFVSLTVAFLFTFFKKNQGFIFYCISGSFPQQADIEEREAHSMSQNKHLYLKMSLISTQFEILTYGRYT